MQSHSIDKMKISKGEKEALKFQEMKRILYDAAKKSNATVSDGLLFGDLTKTPSKTYTQFDKEQYRSAIEKLKK